MTNIIKMKRKCAVCGKTGEYTVVLSTLTVGPSDLDTRPSEMARSTIDKWIQICPSCGYCAPDIGQRIGDAARIVSSASYQQQLNKRGAPRLVNAFLCYSLLEESAGNYANAGWACIYAAWVCDDAGCDVEARKCRMKAVSLLQKARENGQRFAEQVGEEEAIMVDLLRRSGEFELALKMCDEGLEKNPGKTISDILRFQKVLIRKRDVARHTVAEATGEDEYIGGSDDTV